MEPGIIYKITNTLNGKCYVGQTTQDLKRRLRAHKRNKESIIGLAIKKYGWKNFTVEILEECASIDELNEREIFWIAKLNCIAPNGYNLTAGGNNAPLLEESRLKVALAHKGVPDRPHTTEERTQLSEKAKKRCADPAVRAQMSFVQRQRSRKVICVETGMVFNSQTDAAEHYGISRKAIGDVCNGRRKRAGGYHWKFADEDLNENPLRKTKAVRKVLCVETGEVFNSQAEISRRYGINSGSICRACNGHTLTLAGYHWQFIDDETISKTEGLKISSEPLKLYENKPNKRRVQCVETGEIFESIADAAKKSNCVAASIGKVCQGYLKTTGGFHWKFVDDDIKNENVSDETRGKMRTNQPNRKRVLCVETGEIFESIYDAATKYNCYTSQISRACRNKLKQTQGFHWRFVDESDK